MESDTTIANMSYTFPPTNHTFKNDIQTISNLFVWRPYCHHHLPLADLNHHLLPQTRGLLQKSINIHLNIIIAKIAARNNVFRKCSFHLNKILVGFMEGQTWLLHQLYSHNFQSIDRILCPCTPGAPPNIASGLDICCSSLHKAHLASTCISQMNNIQTPKHIHYRFCCQMHKSNSHWFEFQMEYMNRRSL